MGADEAVTASPSPFLDPVLARSAATATGGEREAAPGRDPTVASGPALVAGIGFRHATEAEEIVALVRRALDEAGIAAGRLGLLATADDRAGEPAIVAAAARLGVPVAAVAVEALREAGRRVQTRSARIEALRGVGSLAEAAALAASGPGGRLVLARIASPSATCALAAAGDPS